MKKTIVPAVVFQRNLGTRAPAERPARLVLFEAELARVTGGLARVGTLTYDAPGVPGDSID